MTTAQIKHKRLAQSIVKHHGDKITAYREVYPNCTTDASANTLVNRAIAKNPLIREDIGDILQAQGITESVLTGKLKGFLTATKDIVTGKGEVVSCRDNATQMDAVKTGLRLHGHLGTGTSIDARSVTVNNTIDHVQVDQLSSVVESLKAMNAQLTGDSDAQTGKVEDVEFIRPVEEK